MKKGRTVTEPLFRATANEDPEMQEAYAKAASSIAKFIALVELNEHEVTIVKLRFRDPDLSEETGKDQFLYLWLNEVLYHKEDTSLSGVLFELPKELEKWHKIGERLGFESEDVFDWCAIQKGNAIGGFTLQATRNQMKTEQEKIQFDERTGIDSFVKI